MKAMTFGSTSSPCSAQYVKNSNALEFAEECPEAAKAITDRHYVDDYLGSAHRKEAAETLIAQVCELHRRGGFCIRNWTCSSPEVLEKIPPDLRAKQQICKVGDETERVLGLNWNPTNDTFTFLVNFGKVQPEVLSSEKFPTKREMLRVLMSMFDPLAFVAYFTIADKILLQDVWKAGLGWDDELREILLEK